MWYPKGVLGAYARNAYATAPLGQPAPNGSDYSGVISVVVVILPPAV
jgi:hypothetical protein